jgi:hypothetical protein
LVIGRWNNNTSAESNDDKENGRGLHFRDHFSMGVNRAEFGTIPNGKASDIAYHCDLVFREKE